jgi:glycosyltransferase involved in cell wall biosynthesis
LKRVNINKYDVLHPQDQLSFLLCSFIRILKPSIKIIFTVHNTGEFGRYNFIARLLLRFRTHMVIAISNPVLNECKEEGIVHSQLIYNGIYLNDFHIEKRTPSEKFTIINVSRLDIEQKGQDILLKASAICRDKGYLFDLIFIGKESPNNKKSRLVLDELVEKLELQDLVHFMGIQHDVRKYFKQSDLFVLSSRYEGFGNVVIEAMAAELPVLVSNVDGPGELVRDGQNGLLFNVGDEQDLANKIIILMDNKEKRDTLALEGKKFSEGFDISKMIEKHYDLYSTLV